MYLIGIGHHPGYITSSVHPIKTSRVFVAASSKFNRIGDPKGKNFDITKQLAKSLGEAQKANSDNTTIIGGVMTSSFSKFDFKWLVQSFPKDDAEKLAIRVRTGQAIVDRDYVFI